jgi:hypothetical protein
MKIRLKSEMFEPREIARISARYDWDNLEVEVWFRGGDYTQGMPIGPRTYRGADADVLADWMRKQGCTIQREIDFKEVKA